MSDRYKGAILSPTAPTVTPQSAGGIYTSSQQLQYQGQGVWPSAFNNPINNSLRFRSSASAYLNRTPASNGNRQIMTWSGWVKRGTLGSSLQSAIFSAGTGAGNHINWALDQIELNLKNSIDGASNVFLVTSAVFRDPSAWYHIVFAVDTTQATASNRVKLYVNGIQVTAFSTTTYPSQNSNLSGFNNTTQHDIALDTGGSNFYFDGYLAETNFIDGQALTPSSFGTTDAYGIWQPIPYTGTYGTNGFYLKFTDNSALTTSSNVGLGRDFSGNANYWVTNNISITAGATYDSMVDVPTNTNSNTANYAVMNPLSSASSTITNGNLTFSGANKGGKGNFGLDTGKWYWENTITTVGSTDMGVGIIFNDATDGMRDGTVNVTYGVMYQANSNVRKNSSVVANYASYTTGDVIGITYDADTRSITFYKNNTSQGSITADLPTSSYVALIMQPAGTSNTINVNFGQRPFSYTPPTGFLPLNTYNLPTPTILAGNQYFDVKLYTGDATSPKQVVTGLGFQPDFAWTKTRSASTQHALYDAVRGAGSGKILLSNTTDAEGGSGGTSDATYGYLSAFNSDGFTTTKGSDAINYFFNNNTVTYVSWLWKANGAGSSNTQGTITSTVSANTTAGFSIVTWSGDGNLNATVGHGLGIAPVFQILKRRNSSTDWRILGSFSPLGTFKSLGFNTNGIGTPGDIYPSLPTSTVFFPGNSGDTNASGGTYVAYCFAAVSGYSAFGSYTGNGSTDGPFIYTGFRPAFIMIKLTSSGGEAWTINDDARNTYNVSDSILYPNLSDAEGVGSGAYIDFLSNGFKIRNNNPRNNANGSTYIYACFAESPFKISRAR